MSKPKKPKPRHPRQPDAPQIAKRLFDEIIAKTEVRVIPAKSPRNPRKA